MTRKAGSCVVLALIGLLGACGVGDEGGGGDDGGGDDGTPLPPNPNPDKIVCSVAYTLTGTWAAIDPLRPAEEPDGCWPVGNWTFTIAVNPTGEVPDINADGKGDKCGEVSGTNAPALLSSYSFRVDRTDPGDGWLETDTVTSDTTAFVSAKASVNSSGNAICEGHVEMLSQDKKAFWNLRPSVQQNPPTGTNFNLTGSAEYTLYIDPVTPQ